jgi:hypothetical protein
LVGLGNQLPLVDITSLLTLPQKEAAHKLGISESMLCKRFKECTQRKWPYRQLCKIDKTIAAITHSRRKGSNEASLPPGDAAKVKALRRERESILAPVSIRLTSAYDDLSDIPAKAPPPAHSHFVRSRNAFNNDDKVVLMPFLVPPVLCLIMHI